MSLLLLLAACGGARALYGDAQALADAASYDDAIATYDEVGTRWPESKWAGPATEGAVAAYGRKIAQHYDDRQYGLAVDTMDALAARIGADNAERVALEYAGEGFRSAQRLVQAQRQGPSDPGLVAITDLLGQPEVPPGVRAVGSAWVCDDIERFPAWAACEAAGPEGPDVESLDWTAALTACTRLDQLAPHCSQDRAAEIRAVTAARRSPAAEPTKELAPYAGILGALADDEGSGQLGASGLGGLLGPKGIQTGPGGLGSRGSGLGGGSAEGLGGLGTTGRGGSTGYGSGGFGNEGAGGLIVGEPTIAGALDRPLIDEVLKRHLSQIRYCYQRELTKDPDLAGEIVVQFTISGDGSVSESVIQSSTMGNDAVERCIAGRFPRMAFPSVPGGGAVIASYPFGFSPQ